MLLRAYSIFDRKSLVYNTPFFTHTNAAAVRMLSDLVNDAGTNIGRHPADYVLYCIGHYSDQDAGLSPFAPLEHVVDAVALVRQAPAPLFDKEAK